MADHPTDIIILIQEYSYQQRKEREKLYKTRINIYIIETTLDVILIKIINNLYTISIKS